MSTQANQETQKTLTIVDRSTKALNTAAASIVTVVSGLQGIAEHAATLSSEIEFKQSELQSLDEAIVNKQRALAAELRLIVKEDEEGILQALLKDRKLIAVDPSVIKELEKSVQETKQNTDSLVKQAVDAALAQLKREHDATVLTLTSDHAVASAQMEASSTALGERLSFLESQNAKLEQQINDDRNARVEIAKAEAQRQPQVIHSSK